MTNGFRLDILSPVKKKALQVVSSMDEMANKLKEKLELSILFDFYGELLKEQNKHIVEDHILNDLSLGEIAQEYGISRQGVYDIVKRSSKQLRAYEESLHLVKKFESTKTKVSHIKELSQSVKLTKDINLLDEIIQLSETILNDL